VINVPLNKPLFLQHLNDSKLSDKSYELDNRNEELKQDLCKVTSGWRNAWHDDEFYLCPNFDLKCVKVISCTQFSFPKSRFVHVLGDNEIWNYEVARSDKDGMFTSNFRATERWDEVAEDWVDSTTYDEGSYNYVASKLPNQLWLNLKPLLKSCDPSKFSCHWLLNKLQIGPAKVIEMELYCATIVQSSSSIIKNSKLSSLSSNAEMLNTLYFVAKHLIDNLSKDCKFRMLET
jgi:hypothetical protein